MPEVVLRPARSADWALVARWLDQPEVRRWWGDHASATADVRLAMETPSAICRIIEAEGTAVGYAHAIDATCWGAALPEPMPAGTWDVDIFIAEADYRRRGVGACALRMLADEVFATTLAVAVSVFVSVRNEPGARAYEKAGFRWVGVCDSPHAGHEWLMLLERPGETVQSR